MTWHLLPGNHDPARPAGVWERLTRIGPPANVRLHLAPEPSELMAQVWLLPAPVVAGQRAEDPTQWMNEAPTPDGAVRLGLAHGSMRDFGSAGGEGIIAPSRWREARLDYLALGDWHGLVQIDERTWYPGTPEPDRYLDNKPGHSLIVRIPGPGSPPVVTAVPTAQFLWHERRAVIECADDLARLEADLLALSCAPDSLLVRLTLEGWLPLGDMARIETWQGRLAERLRHLDLDTAEVQVAREADGSLPFSAGTQLHAAACWLQGIFADPNDDRRDTAQAALVRLLALTADNDEGRTR
jgi:hypothetical protein